MDANADRKSIGPDSKTQHGGIGPETAHDHRQLFDKKELPAKVDNEFVSVLQQVFQGLEKLTLNTSEIKKALTDGGTPCAVTEIKARFDKHLETLTRGKDASKIAHAPQGSLPSVRFPNRHLTFESCHRISVRKSTIHGGATSGLSVER
jgi:hypothetical protein